MWKFRVFRGLSIFTVVMIGLLSLSPVTPDTPVTFLGIDKLFHAAAYCVLAFLVVGSLKNQRWGLVAWSLIACVAYGGLLEMLQRYTGRSPEGADLLFDALGVLAGGFAGRCYFNWKRSARS